MQSDSEGVKKVLKCEWRIHIVLYSQHIIKEKYDIEKGGRERNNENVHCLNIWQTEHINTKVIFDFAVDTFIQL